jgi:hypothetical protein
MDDLNLAALPYLRALAERPLEIKDVASSSGISTQEWHSALLAAGIKTRIIGTDFNTEALHIRGRLVDMVMDKNLNVIHLSVIGTAVHPRVLKVVRLAGLNAVVRLCVASGARVAPLRLVSKAVKNVEMVADDIETSSNEPVRVFHVIRAANILNLAYFGPDRLCNIVLNLLRSLRSGGLFIVCRTHENGSNHGTIFRYEGSRLRPLERLGEGSELESILPLTLQDHDWMAHSAAVSHTQ